MALQLKPHLPQKSGGTQLSTHKINSFRSLLGASLAMLDQDPGSAKNSRPNGKGYMRYMLCLGSRRKIYHQENFV
jgi:hypothetical protein